MSQNFNIAPYYDDFDETKQFYKVLFRPGVAVQTREVNQLQSILQNQVAKIGDHLFKEGSMVIPGQVNYNDKLSYLKLSSTNLGALNLTDLEDLYISNTVDGVDGVEAQVIKAIPATTTDPITLVLLYTKSNQTIAGLADVTFAANSTLYVVGDNTKTVTVTGGTGVSGRTVAAGLQAGVYYLAGHFVTVPSAVLSVKKYADTVADISVKIGIQYTETIVTADSDTTLYDNATGSPNAAAPGAHRYKISTEFVQVGLDENPLNFFELIRVEEGTLQSLVNASQYNILEETLARRTYDESGNYVVDDFKFDIREDRNNNRGSWVYANYLVNDVVKSTGGKYFVCIQSGLSNSTEPTEFAASTTDETTVISDGSVKWRYTTTPQSNRGVNLSGSSNSLVATFGIGKAYVHGHEVSKLANSNITIPKARDTKTINNHSVNMAQGNYIYVDKRAMFGAPDISTGPAIQLFDRFIYKGTGNKFGLGNQVGTARIGWTEPDSRGFIRVGLNNIVMNPGKAFDRDVNSIAAPDTTTSTAVTSYTLTSLIKYAGNSTSSFLQVSGLLQTTSQGSTAMIVTSNLTTAYNLEIAIGDVITFGTSSHAATCSWTVTNIINSSTMVLSGPPMTQAAGATTAIFVRFAAQTVFGHATGVGTRFQSEYRIGDKIWLGSSLTGHTVVAITNENRMLVSSNITSLIAQTSHGTYYANRSALFAADVGGSYQYGVNAKKITGLHQLQDYSGGTTTVQSHNALRIQGTNDAKYQSELAVNDYIDINGNKLLVTKISSNTVAYAIALEGTITGAATQYPAFRVNNNLIDAQNSTLLFPIAPSSVSSMTDNVYTVYKTQTVSGVSGLNTASVTLASATINNAAEALATTDVNAFFVAQNAVATLSGPISVTNVTLSTAGTAVITINSTFSSNTARIIFPVTRAAASNDKLGFLRSKTLTYSSGDEFLANFASSTLVLSKADVLRVVKVYMHSTSTATWSATIQSQATDITSRYDLDNGQRDQHYDVGRLKLRPGAPAPTGSVKVFYDYFEHGTGDYFARASYDPTVVPYEDIPVYGQTRLGDVLDFRSKIDPTNGLLSNSAPPRFGSNFVADVSYYLGRKEKIFLDGNGSFYNVSGVSDLVPQKPVVADNDNSIELYDLELLPYTRSSRFPEVKSIKYDNRRYTMKDIGGIEKRVTNLEETTALSLLETKTQSLQIRDNLDSTLERYKTGFFVDNFSDNSNSEESGDSRYSLDTTNRTLNVNTNYDRISLVEKINYTPGIYTSSELTAANVNRRAENYKVTGDLLTLNYTTSTMLRQELATTSIAIAPFIVASFLGSLKVTPDKDVYEIADYKTAVVAVTDNRTAEKLAAQVAELRKTWSRPYAVQESTTQTFINTTKTTNFLIPFCRANTLLLVGKGLKPKHKFYPFFDDIPIESACTGAIKFTFDSMPIIDFNGKTPTGATEWARWRSLYKSVDVTEFNRIRSVYNSYRRFVASYDSIWKTKTTEPKTLDASLPSSSLKDAYRLAFGNGTTVYYYEGGKVVGSGVVVYQEDTTLYIVNGRGKLAPDFLRTAGSYNYTGVWYVGVDGADPKYLSTTNVSATDALTSDANGYLYTNSNGVAICTFDLPETDTLKFTTGQKPVTFTDDIDNHPDNWSSKADGSYFVEGYDVTYTNNYRTTHNYVLRPYDPIAQSFKLPTQFENGAFITDIDVFFHTKPVTELAPVSLELRTCDSTGRPSGTEMVPGTEVTLMPDQITVDATYGQIPTKFTFRAPVYLMPDKQYAFVLRTDTKNYRVWMATMGQPDVKYPTSSYTTQATFGSLFKSQDGTLWTEDQTSDLKFRINRAVFSTAANGGRAHVVNNSVETAQLPSNPLTFVHGSNKIRVSQQDHGFSSGDTTRLYSKYYAGQWATLGVNAKIQGIPVGEIFGSYVSSDTTTYIDNTANPVLTVSDVTLDTYTVTVSTNADITGGTTGLTYVIDGGADIIGHRNIAYQAIRPTASILTFQPTELTMTGRIAKGFTYDTDSNSFGPYTSFTRDLDLNAYNILDTSCAVLSKTVEVNGSRFTTTNIDAGVPGTGGTAWSDSFVGVFNLKTTTDHVSPVIDLSTLYLNTARHRTDNPAAANRIPVLAHTGTTSIILTISTIANSSTVVSFDNTSRKINSELEGTFSSVVPGRYITISGSSQAGNNYTSTGVLVTNVSADGRSINVSANLVTYGYGDGITIRQYDDFTEETTTTDASGESKYITKVVSLKNPATQIKFQLEACVPSSADFDVYYKTGSNGENFNNLVWTKFVAPNQIGSATSSYTSLVKTDTRGNFTDVEFNISTFDNIGNPVDLSPFTAFQIKLVMRSSNAARVPQFRNMRAIAHA